MTTHRLKSTEQNFLAIASGQRVDPRLADRNFQPGDKVTFVRYDPATNTGGAEATVKVTHVARFGRALFASRSDDTLSGEYAILGLSRPNEPVLVPASGAIDLKTWPEQFESLAEGRRVDLRVADRQYKHGVALLFQEYVPEDRDYTGNTALRQVRRVTPWTLTAHYTPAQLREHGVAVLGWKGLEAKVA